MTKRQLFRLLERERESFAAERGRLIDVICHLGRNPWTLPPREDVYVPDPEPVTDYAAAGWNPDQ